MTSKEELIDEVAAEVRDNGGDLSDEDVRKSKNIDDEDFEKSAEDLSISKYFRGAILGDWDDAEFERYTFEKINKATQDDVTGPRGGFLIPEETTNEILERLRSEAVIRSLGATTYNITGDTLRIRRLKDSVGGSWAGKTDSSGSEASENDLLARDTLNLKKYIAIVSIDNDLLEAAAEAVDTIIEDDLTKDIRLAEDLAFLEGDGNKEPLGLYNDPDINDKVLNGAPDFDDLLDMKDNIEGRDGDYNYFVMHPSAKNYFRGLKDGDGNYIWDEGDPANGNPSTLWNIPVATTTQVSTSVDSSGNLSGGSLTYLVLGNFNNFAIGQRQGQRIQMAMSNTAEDAFTEDETWMRAKMKVDGMAKYAEEFEVLKAINIS